MITGVLPLKIGETHLSAEVRYLEDDPFTLLFIFSNGHLPDVTWHIGRDLVAEGLNSDFWVGEGDVKIRRDSHNTVQVWLNAPEGIAEVSIPWRPFKVFLDRTEALVPYGKEGEQLDWDEFDGERALW